MLRTATLAALATATLAATPAFASAGPKATDAGYVMVQGRQVFLLTALPGQDLAARGIQIRRRLEAAVSKDGTIQPVGIVSLTDVAGTPVVSVGNLPIASVTAWDAARAGQPAWALAHRFAASLEEALATLRLGGPMPEQMVALKTTGGTYVALDPAESGPVPAAQAAAASALEPGPIAISLRDGRITATIEAGVVTLTGQAATLAEKMDVAHRIAAVPGVVDVINKVAVSIERQRTDAELASALGGFAQ